MKERFLKIQKKRGMSNEEIKTVTVAVITTNAMIIGIATAI